MIDKTMQTQSGSNVIDESVTSYFISFSESANNDMCDNATVSLSACQDGVCSHYFNVTSSPCSFTTNDVAISVFAINNLEMAKECLKLFKVSEVNC